MSAPFDFEMFGSAIGDMLAEQAQATNKRFKQVEDRLSGMQTKLDKCMSFSGEFQPALDYAPGALVRRGQELFVSTRHIKSGSSLVARDGSGWERI